MRTLAAAALLTVAVLLAYSPSLGGGWVWDGKYFMGSELAWAHPSRLILMEENVATGQPPGDIYRPLRWLSTVALQAVAPGPSSERLANLALHLAVVGVIAALALGLGATRRGAGMAAAIFALHPMVSESVAWPQARPELLLGVLFLGALLASVRGRPLLAGLLLLGCPFIKEVGVVAPLAAAPFLLALRGPRERGAWLVLGVGVGGVAAYLGLREALGIGLPTAGVHGALLGPLGGITARAVELLVVPGSADAFAAYQPALALGALGIAAAVGLLLTLPRWPGAGLLLGAGALLAPSGLASASNGVFGDRYVYVPMALAAVAGAGPLGRLLSRRVAALLWLLPPLLGAVTFAHSSAWTDDESLARASLLRNPQNARAAFHLAHALQTREGDCAAAVPLYELAVVVEPRARTNLVGCLLDLGAGARAAERGLALLGPDAPVGLIFNTARALADQRRYPEAESLAREALRRDPEHEKAMVFLGDLLVVGHRPDEARSWYQRALGLDPANRGATRGLRRLER